MKWENCDIKNIKPYSFKNILKKKIYWYDKEIIKSLIENDIDIKDFIKYGKIITFIKKSSIKYVFYKDKLILELN